MKRAAILIFSVLVIAAASTAWGQSDKTITVQTGGGPQPKIASPASIGAPHICNQDYPADAVAAHIEGKVILGFTITDAGTTTNVHVVNSSGTPSLDDAAVTCVARWLYRPAMQNGAPVAVPWKAQVMWMLNMPEGLMLAATPLEPHDCTPFKPRRVKIATGAMTTLQFAVTDDGKVTDITIAISSGERDLDNAAVKCAAQWHYKPAKYNGQFITSKVRENVAWSTPTP